MDEKPPAYQPQEGGNQQGGYPAPPAYGNNPQGGNPYPQPQQQYNPPPQQQYVQPTTVVVGGINPAMMSTQPVQMTCPSCGAQVVTRVEFENGSLTWLLFVILLFVFICVSCVPFCVDDCKDAMHFCPNCNAHIATKRRM